jgi:hypothetical protein
MFLSLKHYSSCWILTEKSTEAISTHSPKQFVRVNENLIANPESVTWPANPCTFAVVFVRVGADAGLLEMIRCDPLQHPSAEIRHNEVVRLGMFALAVSVCFSAGFDEQNRAQ